MAVLPRVIEDWASEALRAAEFETLPNNRVFARVPCCVGAVATGGNEREATEQLLGVLEDWARVGLRLGDEIPIIGGIDLNTDEIRELAQSGEL